MSDRFKFRVWDVQNQKYLYFDLLNKGSLSDFEYFATEEAPDYNEQIECPDTNCWALIMEQSTGLKDKDSKLIYDRDIVEYSDDYWIVIYNKSRMEWGLMGYDYAIYGRDIKKYDLDVISCEIIGNVHENPELLEDINDN